MTVLVSVKINDGVVMAADSASSYASGTIYNNPRKIVNIREGLTVGVMVTGAGGIGNESFETLLKNLRQDFSDKSGCHAGAWLDRTAIPLKALHGQCAIFASRKSLSHTEQAPGPSCVYVGTQRGGRWRKYGKSI